MSVILVDLGDDKHDVVVSNAGWRDTVQIMRTSSLFDEERLKLLETYWLGQQFTSEDACAVANALIKGPLASIYWSDNVYPPPWFWVDPGKYRREQYELATYWPSWLRAFVGFCMTCRGFICY